MEVAGVNVAVREARGRIEVNQVRDAGGIPAVLYGRGGENISITLPAGAAFEKLVLTHHKLFELQFEDGAKEEAYLHDMQWDALRDELVHVDFKRIDLTEKMNFEIELRFVGTAKGLSRNGVFEAPLKMLPIECVPTDLPEHVRVIVNELDLDDKITVKDLILPEGVTALEDGDTIVCLVKAKAGGQDEDDSEGGEGDGEGGGDA